MPARLVALTPGAAPTIVLQRPVLLVGRHPECDVRIDLPAISRRHCCLAQAYERTIIRDLGSRHGVRVNGRIVHEGRLLAGDEVAIGPLLYRFEEAPAPARPAPALPRPEAAAPAPRPKPMPRPKPIDDFSMPQMPVNLRDLEQDLIGLDD